MSDFGHRERVIATLNHQVADRVPLDLMGNSTMLVDQTYERLRDHLRLEPIPPIRHGTTANFYDERMLEYFDVDFRRVFLKRNPRNEPQSAGDGSFVDEFGVRKKKVGAYVHFVDHPLAGVTTVKEVEAYCWPNVEEVFSTEGLAEEAKRLYDSTDYALVARNPITFGLLDRACNVMGIANFMVCMAQQPRVAQAIMSHLTRIFCDIYGLFLDAVGPYVHMVEYGDDLGGQAHSLISPQMFREFIKPGENKLFSLIHQKAPQAAVFHHTDGSIFDLVPDLIEAGVDVLNPVQTSAAGMDPLELKTTYAESLVFHGGIEQMDGPKDQLIEHVRRMLDTLGAGGGYILASCNTPIDVPPENIIAMFEFAAEYGRYT